MSKVSQKEKKLVKVLDDFVKKLIDGIRRPTTIYLTKADYQTYLKLKEKKVYGFTRDDYKGFKVVSL